jgi:hypothetical protein
MDTMDHARQAIAQVQGAQAAIEGTLARLHLSSRRLAPDDLPGAVDRVRIVDAFASLADPEHGGSAR